MGLCLDEACKLKWWRAPGDGNTSLLPSCLQGSAALRSCARSLWGSLLGLWYAASFPRPM